MTGAPPDTDRPDAGLPDTGPPGTGLSGFFTPETVALVGASDRSAWSRSIAARFNEYGHRGALFAVNRHGRPAHGLPGFTRIGDIPVPPDMAFIFVPAVAVPDALREAGEAGVRGAVILSSGFAEAGEEGAALQRALAAIAERFNMCVLGPNALGFANFAEQAFCTSIRTRLPVLPGGLGIVSQSGAVASELARWAHAQRIGLSFLCATGNEAQLGIADVVDHLVDHDATRAIAVYAEGIGHPARFQAAALRARAAGKPIVVLKLGRSAVSRAVAAAHTGSLLGDDGVFDALCARYGIARVSTIEELICTAELLGRCGPIRPPRIGFVSVSGGACGMYAELAARNNVAMPAWSAETRDALRALLPPFAATLNPLDTTGVVVQEPALWSRLIPVLARDPGIGLVVTGYGIPNTPADLDNTGPSFEAISRGYRDAGARAAILSLAVQDVTELQAGLRRSLELDLVLPGLDIGVRALGHLQRWSENLAAAAPRPMPAVATAARRPRTEREVLDHLAAHGVAVIPAVLAADADAAAAAATRFGGPVAMKIASADIAHKTEAGGVRLGVRGTGSVRAAFADIVDAVRRHAPDARLQGVIVSPMRAAGVELIVGVVRDPLWGPAILVGLGGVFTELLADRQIELLPIAASDALRMLSGLRGAAILQGFRGMAPVDLVVLAELIVRIGDAALALGPDLSALEVNPVLALGDRAECLDGLATFATDGDAASS